jgi:hypothetical protein
MRLEGTERIERVRILLGHITVEEVLTRYDVEILDRVDSRKGGTELVTACPFHATNSPNFYINDENGKFICRSAFCGVKGDLVHFVALKEHCDHVRAYRFLCNLAGIDPGAINPLAITMSVIGQIGRKKETSELETLVPMAIPHGYKVLAHPYLVRARGISPHVLKVARCGAIMEDPFYTYRACIPIEMRGHLFSMYSRATASQDAWKKANPKKAGKANALFPKHHYSGSSMTSHLLYGLDYAAQAGGGEVILVEASISVLKLRTLGIGNAVAMLKAGLSDAQVRRLIEHPEKITKIIICSDNDEKVDPDTGDIINPGQKAAWNTYQRLKKFFEVGVARLPVNIDPADMDDIEEFEDVLDHVLWPQGRTKERQAIDRFFEGRL